MRACYEEGLARDAALTGRVAVRFIIDTDGWVRSAYLSADETGDAAFAACVVRQFVGLRYPDPDGGRVTVVYPLVFLPESD
jgi:hypothetical protein